MKKSLKKIINFFGYTVIPFKEEGENYKDLSNDDVFSFFKTGIGDFYLPKDSYSDIVAKAIRRGVVFEKEVVNTGLSYIKDDSIVLDIGANFGQMSILFSKSAKNVTVYSFEAQKNVFNILEKNIKANNCSNVKTIYNAVYNKDNIELTFSEPEKSKFGTTYGSLGINTVSTKGLPVKSITIDSLIFDKPISFMKIDIQGCDLFALQGAINTINKHRMPIIFEFEQHLQADFNTSLQDYFDFFNNINYKFDRKIYADNFLVLPK